MPACSPGRVLSARPASRSALRPGSGAGDPRRRSGLASTGKTGALRCRPRPRAPSQAELPGCVRPAHRARSGARRGGGRSAATADPGAGAPGLLVARPPARKQVPEERPPPRGPCNVLSAAPQTWWPTDGPYTAGRSFLMQTPSVSSRIARERKSAAGKRGDGRAGAVRLRSAPTLPLSRAPPPPRPRFSRFCSLSQMLLMMQNGWNQCGKYFTKETLSFPFYCQV